MNLVVSGILAVVINLGLFWMMEEMVERERGRVTDVRAVAVVDFVRSRPDSDTRTKDRARRAPPKPAEMADSVARLQEEITQATFAELPLPLEALAIDEGLGTGTGPALAGILTQAPPGAAPAMPEQTLRQVLASELTPVSMPGPLYPPIARSQGIEGFVEVGFLVTERGDVANPRVLQGQPPGVFDEAALAAVRNWRFRPQMEEGEPVPVYAHLRLSFQLDRQ